MRITRKDWCSPLIFNGVDRREKSSIEDIMYKTKSLGNALELSNSDPIVASILNESHFPRMASHLLMH